MDIWSCGVIMADLFKYICEDENNKKVQIKRPSLQIFHGTHCFPASPKNARIETDGFPTTEGHVLESIFDIIGTPNELDMSFITDESASIYIKKF